MDGVVLLIIGLPLFIVGVILYIYIGWDMRYYLL